jgi:hypothetical protein
MPSENVPTRREATASSPTMPSTSSTRRRGIAFARASAVRCARALRPRVHRRGLEHRADLVERPAHPPVGDAADRHRARRGRIEAEDQAHRRRLARAVGPEEAGDVAGPDLERQPVDGQRRAIALRQAIEADDGCMLVHSAAAGNLAGRPRLRDSRSGCSGALVDPDGDVILVGSPIRAR